MAYPTAASVAILISCIIAFLLLCYPLLWPCAKSEALGRIAKQEKWIRACSIPLPPEGASLGELGLTPGGLAENGLAIAAHHDGLRVAEHCRSATQSHGRTLQSTQIVQDEVPIEA
ncbi:hypothetical protein BHE74_00025070 [Ensete ventricosum]|nr:hypothetical protein BHE74_00025070 [Ensete ventricosum]